MLPMALSPFAFVVKYMFGMFTLVQVIGLLNGLFFLPAFLGSMGLLFGPSSKAQNKQNSDASAENFPRVLDSPGAGDASKNNEKDWALFSERGFLYFQISGLLTFDIICSAKYVWKIRW